MAALIIVVLVPVITTGLTFVVVEVEITRAEELRVLALALYAERLEIDGMLDTEIEDRLDDDTDGMVDTRTLLTERLGEAKVDTDAVLRELLDKPEFSVDTGAMLTELLGEVKDKVDAGALRMKLLDGAEDGVDTSTLLTELLDGAED